MEATFVNGISARIRFARFLNWREAANARALTIRNVAITTNEGLVTTTCSDVTQLVTTPILDPTNAQPTDIHRLSSARASSSLDNKCTGTSFTVICSAV